MAAFLSSALSTGLAATHLAARLFGSVDKASEQRVKKAETKVLGAELGLTIASGLLLRSLARPLLIGRLALIFQIGSVGLGMLVPLVLHRLGARGPLASILSPALTLLGGAIMRSTVHEAGMRSADDPQAYFEYTRPKR